MVLSVARARSRWRRLWTPASATASTAPRPHEVEWDIPAQTGPLPQRKRSSRYLSQPCFGVAYREPLAEGDLKRELLLGMLGDLVVGGLTKLYRRLYDEALVNPEFSR